MSPREEVLQRVLALSPEDRAYVTGVLLEDSLTQTPSPIEEGVAGSEFAAELRRRSAAYRAGTSTARSAVEVLTDLGQRQADEIRP